MKFLLPLLLLFGCNPAHAVPRILDADIVRGIRSVQNYVKNPEFETNIANVTDGGAGIITWSTVSPVDNTGSLVINSLVSGEIVKIQTKAQQKKLEGQGCVADFYYTGNASNYKAYVLNGITNVSGDFPLANAGGGTNYQLIPFPCQAAGDTVDIAIESTAITAGQIKLDSIFEGQNFYSNLPGFTLGSILFSDGTSITEDNARLFWDTVNFRLGINTNAPSQALDVVGNAQASGSITASGVLKSLSSLVLEDPGAGTNTVTIQSGVPTASYVLTLPVDDGTANQVLATDGSGNLSWATPSGGGGAPTGTIVAFVGSSAPSGWLLCDGSTINRTSYAALYAVIGDAYGNGDGSTTFHLPDLRGRFLRGVDNAAGNDPDAASRTASNGGGNTGDAVGSLQADQLASHSHSVAYGATISSGTYAQITIGPLAGYVGTTATGGNETRPKNVNVNYIIKY